MKKSTHQAINEFISYPANSNFATVKKSASIMFKHSLRIALMSLFLFAMNSASAFTYFSRTNNGNWNANTTWSTVTYGSATNAGTFPVAGDIVNIGDGYTINITSSPSCATLNVGQGVSGILQFGSAANYTLTITGNLTVNNGGTLCYNIAVNRTHAISLGGNLTNFGTIDLYLAAGQVANITFNTASNSTVSGTGTFDLNTVVLTKTTSTATQLNITSNTFEAGIKSFTGNYGTYIHNNSSSFNINPTASTFTIGPNMIYKVPLGQMWFASVADNVILQGSLYANGGTVLIGTTAGNQGIRSDQNGASVPYLEVSAGTLTVYGGITYGTSSASEPFSFKMTGGTINLNTGTAGTNREVFYVNDFAGSIFNMSGGQITLQKPNIAGSLVADWASCGVNGNVTSTGGTVQFGNASTANGANFNFRPNAGVTFPNFHVSGVAGNTGTLWTANGSTANFQLLSLYIDANKTFDIRSIGGTPGDTKQMTLMSTVNGVDALYNSGTFTARQSTVTFNTTGAQAIGGTVTTTFYSLAINNSSNITLNKPANVSFFLSMVNGKLITTNTNVLTCQSAATASIGSNTSYVDGPMIHTVATSVSSIKTYPIGKGASYRPVVLTIKHTNGLSVTYRGEIFNSPASGLPFSLPASIANVSNTRYARFTRQAVGNFTNATIQMYYDTDDGVTDKNNLLIAHDNGSTAWTNIGGTATANITGNVVSGSFTSFNTYFALANPPGGTNPLPIELSSFNATLINRHVDVKWTTQSEINNDYFTIERSADNINYTSLGTVDGHGTSTQRNNYVFTDPYPLRGISYYRLRQTDFDGTTTVFAPVVINNRPSGGFTVFPNPASSSVVHLSSDESLNRASISVRDITGREVAFTTNIKENGTIDLNIDETIVSKGGIFIVSLTLGTERIYQRLVIN